MKKWFTILAMALIAVCASAQEEGEQESYKWTDLEPDESFLYKYVEAMDEASQDAIEAFYAEKKDLEDQPILKGDWGGWYVKKDCMLPEGNFFESSFYKRTNRNERIYVVIPRIDVTLKSSCKIEGLLEYYGDKVSLDDRYEWLWDGEGSKFYQLICHMKTSQEVLKAIDDRYEFEQECIVKIQPVTHYFEVSSNQYLTSVLTGTNKKSEVEGEKIIYEMNWEGVEYQIIWEDYSEPCPWEGTDEGLAITTYRLQEQEWSLWTTVGLNFAIEKGHDYIVRLTLKVPSDGTYQVGFGKWLGGDDNQRTTFDVPMTASEDFQVIEVESPNFGENVWNDGMVVLSSGSVLGTTVVKKVQVIEKGKGAPAAIKTVKTAQKSDEAFYNLAGQKVNASYKGIVIQSGKKYINK
jgi:hypothetical protein